MILDQARRHFEDRGWSVEDSTKLGDGPHAFTPDLVARKGPQVLAIRADDEALGAYPIGVFAARCQKLKVQGVVICPTSEEVLDACQARRIDYLSPEGLGEPLPTPRTGPPRTTRMVAVSRPVASAAVERVAAPIPWWRWAIVALVWAFAVYFVFRLVEKWMA